MNQLVHVLACSGKLVLAIVPRDHGEEVVAVAKKAGARGGTIMEGRGTAERRMLQLLGLGDTHKELVLILTGEEATQAIVRALCTNEHLARKAPGVILVLNVQSMFKRVFATPTALDQCTGSHVANPQLQEDTTMLPAQHELITVIVNAGYADDIMAAARKAGATGGTIINARGTGKEEDATFFGMTIVPEKDVLLILASKETAEAILEAVYNLPFLTEPGIGIAYCMDVEQFVSLGKKSA